MFNCHFKITLQSSSNACFPIDVTPSGIVIVDIFVFENAPPPILINDDGNSILVNDVHSLKHSLPIDVTPSGIIQFPFSIGSGYFLPQL